MTKSKDKENEREERVKRKDEALGLKRSMKEFRTSGPDSRMEQYTNTEEVVHKIGADCTIEEIRERSHEMVDRSCQFMAVSIDNNAKDLTPEQWKETNNPEFTLHGIIGLVGAPPEVSFLMMARMLSLIDSNVHTIVAQHNAVVKKKWDGPLPPDEHIGSLGYVACYAEILKRLAYIEIKEEKRGLRALSFFSRLFKMREEGDERLDPWKGSVLFGNGDDALIKLDAKKLKDTYNVEEL